MRSGKEKKQNKKFMKFIKARFRVLSKAREIYTKTLFDCAGKAGTGSSVVCPAPKAPQKLPTNYGVCVSDEQIKREEHRERVRVVSKRDRVSVEKPVCGVGRSYSVGVGRIGRIDEDKPCEFEEEDVQSNSSGLICHRKRNFVYQHTLGR
ncbi:hypothetical protein Acr_00g0082270 [Actinidia rufa]|uniref:Uncharacterized protein n=1 Tax=Actinidia rufa TaxID=165716 RepID=A0A7J0DV68_9ERIC|nr:hypothetical protein Acr_00g0082270 [Actinidia rufa]